MALTVPFYDRRPGNWIDGVSRARGWKSRWYPRRGRNAAGSHPAGRRSTFGEAAPDAPRPSTAARYLASMPINIHQRQIAGEWEYWRTTPSGALAAARSEIGRPRRRWRMGALLWLLWSAVAGLLATRNLVEFTTERSALRAVSDSILRFEAPGLDTPHRLQAAVRARLRTTLVTPGARPFLRETAWETWTGGIGACGEGTRVLVNLLSTQGIRAARVNLYGDAIGFMHTAVVYERDGVWQLLDSINSPGDFFDWSVRERRPFSQLASYQVSGSEGGARFVSDNPFFTRFSYIDLSRVVPAGLQLNVLSPPNRMTVLLLENPPLLKAAFTAGAWAAVSALWLLTLAYARSRDARGAISKRRLRRIGPHATR
jgi:hypothetical protein